MYNKLENYQLNHKYLVAIDSDGCVFDTMTLKHQKFFYPLLEEELQLEEYKYQFKSKWDDINLYTSLRGINRFLGVYYLFKETGNNKISLNFDINIYNNYIENHKQITIDGLKQLYNKTKDEFVYHIINWSRKVNEAIEKYMPLIDAFEEAKNTIRDISKMADVAVVSSANEKALIKEWGNAKLLDYVSVLTSQSDGSKQKILKELISKGYNKENVLMIGDSPGDEKAAMENQVHFRMVKAGKEDLSWIDIRSEINNGGIFSYENTAR